LHCFSKYRRNSKPVLTVINIGSQKPVFIKDEMFSPILCIKT